MKGAGSQVVSAVVDRKESGRARDQREEDWNDEETMSSNAWHVLYFLTMSKMVGDRAGSIRYSKTRPSTIGST